jgi:hypothetical protein
VKIGLSEKLSLLQGVKEKFLTFATFFFRLQNVGYGKSISGAYECCENRRGENCILLGGCK